jgi:hypothetical protein
VDEAEAEQELLVAPANYCRALELEWMEHRITHHGTESITDAVVSSHQQQEQRRMDSCYMPHGVTALLPKPSSDSRVIVIVSSVSVPDHIHTKGRRGSIFTQCFHQQDQGHSRANVRYDRSIVVKFL